jgi:hypothetical protein
VRTIKPLVNGFECLGLDLEGADVCASAEHPPFREDTFDSVVCGEDPVL